MIRPKLEASFPVGYRFGKRSGICTKLNGFVKPFNNPSTAGVLTVVRIIAGILNQSGAGRGVATSPSRTQCHACKIQSLSGPPSMASCGGGEIHPHLAFVFCGCAVILCFFGSEEWYVY